MLMNLDDVAEFLRTGRGRARKWLVEHRICPVMELGRGKGGGPRYRDEDVLRAVEDEVTAGRRAWAVPTVFDGTISQALQKLGRGDRGRQGANHGNRAQK